MRWKLFSNLEHKIVEINLKMAFEGALTVKKESIEFLI